MAIAVILLILICVFFFYTGNEIKASRYHERYELARRLFSMSTFAYHLSEILSISSEINSGREKILKLISSKETLDETDREALSSIQDEKQNNRIKEVSSQVRQTIEDYIKILKYELDELSNEVDFNYQFSHKEIKNEIAELKEKVDAFIEKEFSKD